jgi:hypothetical protein
MSTSLIGQATIGQASIAQAGSMRRSLVRFAGFGADSILVFNILLNISIKRLFSENNKCANSLSYLLTLRLELSKIKGDISPDNSIFDMKSSWVH